MNPKLSFNASLYMLGSTRASWGGAPSRGRLVNTPPDDLVLIDDFKDLELPADFTKFDASTRAGAGFAATLPTICRVAFEISLLYDTSAPGVTELLTAAVTQTTVPLFVADGRFADDDESGSGSGASPAVRGLWGDFAVAIAKKTEKLEDGQMITFSLELGISAVPPEWVTIPDLTQEITLTSPQAGTTIAASDPVLLAWTSNIGYDHFAVIVDRDGDLTDAGDFDGTAALTGADLGGTGVHTVVVRAEIGNQVDSNTITITVS